MHQQWRPKYSDQNNKYWHVSRQYCIHNRSHSLIGQNYYQSCQSRDKTDEQMDNILASNNLKATLQTVLIFLSPKTILTCRYCSTEKHSKTQHITVTSYFFNIGLKSIRCLNGGYSNSEKCHCFHKVSIGGNTVTVHIWPL